MYLVFCKGLAIDTFCLSQKSAAFRRYATWQSSLQILPKEMSFSRFLSAVKPGVCVAEEWCPQKKSFSACLEKAPLSEDMLWKLRLQRFLFHVSCQHSSLEFASPENGVPKRNPFLLVSKKRRFLKIRYLAVEPGNCASRETLKVILFCLSRKSAAFRRYANWQSSLEIAPPERH